MKHIDGTSSTRWRRGTTDASLCHDAGSLRESVPESGGEACRNKLLGKIYIEGKGNRMFRISHREQVIN